MKRITTVPSWFNIMANNAMLSTAEVSEVLGITPSSVTRLVAQEVLPKPCCFRYHKRQDGIAVQVFQWKKSVIMNEVRKRAKAVSA